MRYVSLILIGTALASAGCTPDYASQDDSPILFRIVDINGGAPVFSDVSDAGVVIEDTVGVTVAVRSKNPNFDTVPQIAMAVFLEQYEVRFFRTDGRDQEGVDVPFRFTGGLRTVVDVATEGGETVSVPLVRAQAKLEPPLRNLRGAVPDTLGGSAIVTTMIAEITIYGRTTAGHVVKDTGRVTVNFADLAS